MPTPTPWILKRIGKELYVEGDQGQGFVCDMQLNEMDATEHPTIVADAEHIVHCVNTHAALVEALAELVRLQEPLPGTRYAAESRVLYDAIEAANQALAQERKAS